MGHGPLPGLCLQLKEQLPQLVKSCCRRGGKVQLISGQSSLLLHWEKLLQEVHISRIQGVLCDLFTLTENFHFLYQGSVTRDYFVQRTPVCMAHGWHGPFFRMVLAYEVGNVEGIAKMHDQNVPYLLFLGVLCMVTFCIDQFKSCSVQVALEVSPTRAPRDGQCVHRFICYGPVMVYMR